MHDSEMAGGVPVCRRGGRSRAWLALLRNSGFLQKMWETHEKNRSRGVTRPNDVLAGLFWEIIWRQRGWLGGYCSHAVEGKDALNLSSGLGEDRSRWSPEAWRSKGLPGGSVEGQRRPDPSGQPPELLRIPNTQPLI